MPRRTDLESILIIGAGPIVIGSGQIVIGQGCEFDYSGTQACRVLKQEGIRVSLVNSNPATIMTDPEFADATYVEPITTEVLAKVIAKERPDAVLPTLGGQTALNAAVELHRAGVLKKYDIELIGADIDAIEACEDRERFKDIVTGLGAEVPRSTICHGIDECLDIVERELKKGNGVAKPAGEDWLEGSGSALAMLECGPPTEHRSSAEIKLLPDGTYHLACGTSEFGNGISTAIKQIAASILGVRSSDVSLTNADTDRSPYDTGTFASTGTVVAGKATHITAEAMRDDILDFAARHTGIDRDQCRLDNDAVICGNRRILLKELHHAGAKVNHRFTVGRRAYLSPRSIAFNVQGVRLAVHKVTGEIRILHSVHAADIGRPINPMQCRGQLDGAVSMGYGWALIENMVHDEGGHMVNAQLRNCRVPAFADTPHTDIFFANTVDTIGPLGAKSQGECAINPVAPAVSNALANATGVRYAHLPFTPDRLFAALAARK